MRRRSLYLGSALLGLFLAGLFGLLALVLRHEPAFFARAAVAPGEVRKQHSTAFLKEFVRFSGDLYNKVPSWQASFTETQINSFLEEEFLTSHYADKLLPDWVSEPRITIDKDRLRLGFRYGHPPWSTVVSIDFKVCGAPKETNAVVLQLQALHAGALPISAQSLLEQLSETLRKNNIEVTWFSYENRPTAALRFANNQSRASIQISQLDLNNGTLSVAGACFDPIGRPLDFSTPAAPPAVDSGAK